MLRAASDTRKFHKAYNRIREGNFSLEGLLGFDLHGRTVGVVGTGKIGAVVTRRDPMSPWDGGVKGWPITSGEPVVWRARGPITPGAPEVTCEPSSGHRRGGNRPSLPRVDRESRATPERRTVVEGRA